VIDSEEFVVVRRGATAPAPSTPSKFDESEVKVIAEPLSALREESVVSKKHKYLGSSMLAAQATGLPKVNGRSPGCLPPQLNNSVALTHVFRYFVATTAAPVSVSVQDMLGALGGICSVGNSLLKPWSSSFRIHSVTAYPSTAAAAPNENFCALWWNAGPSFQQKDVEESKDVPQGVTMTAPVRFTPPGKTLAGDWLACTATGSTNLFSMFVSAGSIIDLHVSFTLSNQFIPATMTIGTGTLGTIYYLALDGPSSNTIVPAHLPTTH
jgi:hypothetical protein